MHFPVLFAGWLRKSERLTLQELERLKIGAQILEQDRHGIKVLRLPNGDILKFFRVKHFISGARIYSNARRFCRNATRLRLLGIPTVTVKQLYSLEGSSNMAVLYQPLPGIVLRQVARDQGMEKDLLQKYGSFVAYLHQKGILFRSLHLGNVVLTSDGNFGLIDVADMSIRPWPLICSERRRSFRHILRLQEDRANIGWMGWQIFITTYLKATGRNLFCLRNIEQYVARMFTVGGAVTKS